MAAVVYFSSASNNTARFVEHCAFEGAGIHTARIDTYAFALGSGIAGVAAYVFMPVLRDIAAVDPMGSVVAGLGAAVAAIGYVTA